MFSSFAIVADANMDYEPSATTVMAVQVIRLLGELRWRRKG